MQTDVRWPVGDGEMAARIRTHDWAATPLGSVARWPQSLRTAVDMMLAMPGPATILWGPAHVQLYNDAYIPIARERHPTLFARPVAEGWPDAYEAVIAPLLAETAAGRATQLTGYRVALRAPDSGWEERVFDNAWSPIRDEAGAVAGALQTLAEVTDGHQARAALQVSQERQGFLLALSDALRPLVDSTAIQGEACRALAERLDTDRAYYVEIDEAAGTARVERDFVRGAASSLAGAHQVADFAWSVAILRRGECHVVSDTRTSDIVPPADRPACAALGIIACMGAPLIKDGRLVGAFCVTASRPRAWTEGEVEVLREVGERIWAAVERARVEAALRESEARFRGLVEGFGQTTWEADAAGVIVANSPAWCAFTGQCPEEWLGDGWLNAIHPEDRAAIEQKWRETVAAKRPIDAEYRLWHAASLSWRWSNVRAVPITGLDGSVRKWAGMNIDVTEYHEALERQGVLVAELQHRTRNLIAVVRSVAGQTLRTSETLTDFEAAFNDRLGALSRVQGLLSRSEDEPITLGALIHSELDALGAANMPERIVVQGPVVELRKRTVQTFALALHELATNARKYGALATETGRLRVTWRLDAANRRLVLEWIEDGIALRRETQSPTTRRGGYGRELIEHALPYTLGARTTYELEESGVRCTIDMPLGSHGHEDER